MFRRGRERILSDQVIDLVPLNLYPPEESLGFGLVLDYAIHPFRLRREAGRISLRFGEGPGIYYFGHIGYHIDPPWRGQHWAARACLLLKPEMLRRGLVDPVITCDPDNWPSRKICQRLGCSVERVVDVPEDLQTRWELSERKCRYIWRLNV